jgi:hypothetical protein
VAVVAASHQRSSLTLVDREATVLFVRRDVVRLDLERHTTQLGEGWVTTVEQTLLDVAARPDLGDLPNEAHAAIQALLARVDRQLLEELATAQRRRATVNRIFQGTDNSRSQ